MLQTNIGSIDHQTNEGSYEAFIPNMPLKSTERYSHRFSIYINTIFGYEECKCNMWNCLHDNINPNMAINGFKKAAFSIIIMSSPAPPVR